MGVKKLGVRLGNWLTAEQGQALWHAPDREQVKGKRHQAPRVRFDLKHVSPRTTSLMERGFHQQQKAQAVRINDDSHGADHFARICSIDLAVTALRLIRSEAPLMRIFSAPTSLIVASLSAFGSVAAPVTDSKPKCRDV